MIDDFIKTRARNKVNQGYAFPKLLYIVNGSNFPLTFQTKKQ